MVNLVPVMSNETISSSRMNLIGNYIEDGTHRINTLSLNIGGTETIDATRTWLGQPIDILYGGTGATTANTALNNLLPLQTGSANKFLRTDGTNTSWVSALTETIWGTITGTLSDQTDLQNALNLKANLSGATFSGTITATNLSGTNTGDVSVLDSSEIDFTLTGQQITASIKSGSIDETKLNTSVNASLDLADSAIQTELDPVFTAHPAYGLTTQDLIDIGNLSGTNTGDQDLSPFELLSNKSTNTSLGTSDTLYPSQNAVKVYADNVLGSANALVYKGVIDCSTNPNYPAADAGHLYVVSVAGKIGGVSGVDVEVGDMVICNTDGTESGDQATVGTKWNVIQKNIVGAVTGPASSVSNNVAFFDGTTGKVIKDSGLTLSGSNTGDVTVTDSTEIDFTLTGQALTASIVSASIDETKLDASVNASLDLADGALQINQTTPQTTVGTFSFPKVNVGSASSVWAQDEVAFTVMDSNASNDYSLAYQPNGQLPNSTTGAKMIVGWGLNSSLYGAAFDLGYYTNIGRVAGGGDISFSVANSGVTDFSEAMRIKQGSGNVLIGTLSDSGSKLDVVIDNTDYTNSGGSGALISLRNPNVNGQNVVYSEINGNMVAKWRTDYVGNSSWVTGATGNYDFFTGGDYLTGTTKLHINNDGKIGVGAGNSVPSDDFHIKTTTNQTTPQIFIEQDGAGDAAIEMGIFGDSWIWGIDNSDSDYLKLAYSSTQGGGALGTNDKWKINTGGSLAIGGVAPAGIIHTYTNETGVTTTHGRFENASTGGRAQFIVSSGSYPENFFALMTHGQSLSTAHNYYATAIPGTTSDAGKGILLGQGKRMSQFIVGTYDDKPMGFFTNNTLRMSMDSSYGIKVFDDLIVGNNIFIKDNKKVIFGTGDDASIYYNGTNLVVNPKEVGSGYLNIQGKTLVDDKIMFTQTDGNEYIDSLNDGYMDYGATTAHRFSGPVHAVHKAADGTAAVADGTYTIGIGGTTNGTITIKDGIITAVQEAVA